MWKLGEDEEGKMLTSVVQKVWTGEGYPEKRNEGVISPIWKRGDMEGINNYSGVTLSVTGYEVYAGILKERIVKGGKEKGVRSKTQAGFRTERGTLDNISILKHIMGRRNAKDIKTYLLI